MTLKAIYMPTISYGVFNSWTGAFRVFYQGFTGMAENKTPKKWQVLPHRAKRCRRAQIDA
jgi:hypothetical protein